MPFEHQTEPMPGLPAAAITTPTNNTRLENDTTSVTGTAQNMEIGRYYLWLALYDYSQNRHFPQAGPIAVSSNGSWETNVFFESSGRFDITALAADENANEILVTYQSASLSRAQYPGLPALPAGCITLASVTVTRT